MCDAPANDNADLLEQAMDAAAKYASDRPSQTVSKGDDNTFSVTVPDSYTARTSTPALHQELANEHRFKEVGATQNPEEGTVTYQFQHVAVE